MSQDRLRNFKNFGKDTDELRRRRTNQSVELRKARKDEQLINIDTDDSGGIKADQVSFSAEKMETNNPNECLAGLFGEQSVDVDNVVDVSEEAEEVDQVTSTSSGLLCLTGQAEDLLLLLLARGEGGPQRLLTLRLVCSTTKRWVDDLPVLLGRRLFSNCYANLNVWIDGCLEKFLANPPPPHVTSLVLTGACVNFRPKEQSWNRFVQLWSPKLKSLDVDEFLPLHSRLSEFLSSTSIRQLGCEGISSGIPADVPDFLLQLEQLRLYDGRHMRHAVRAIDDSQRQATLLILASPERLVLPNWIVDEARDLKFAADLLRIRKHDVKSQLTFTFGTFSEVDEEDLQNFVTAVAASPCASTIRIEGVPEDFLRDVVLSVRQKDALQFFRCVESIQRFLGNFDDIFLWTDFPNLRNLECLKNDLLGLPALTFLPHLLTNLHLRDLKCSAPDLVTSLIFLNASCPFLETLKMFWICEESQQDEKKNERVEAPQDGAFFPNLTSLSFRMEEYDKPPKDNFAENARLVLSEGLGLPRLSLTSLRVKQGWDDYGYAFTANLFDAELLSALIEGSMGKTLLDLDIQKSWVSDGAGGLLSVLEGMTKENRNKRF